MTHWFIICYCYLLSLLFFIIVIVLLLTVDILTGIVFVLLFISDYWMIYWYSVIVIVILILMMMIFGLLIPVMTDCILLFGIVGWPYYSHYIYVVVWWYRRRLTCIVLLCVLLVCIRTIRVDTLMWLLFDWLCTIVGGSIIDDWYIHWYWPCYSSILIDIRYDIVDYCDYLFVFPLSLLVILFIVVHLLLIMVVRYSVFVGRFSWFPFGDDLLDGIVTCWPVFEASYDPHYLVTLIHYSIYWYDIRYCVCDCVVRASVLL